MLDQPVPYRSQLLLSNREETLPTEVYRVLRIIWKGIKAKAGVITTLHLTPSTRAELKKVQWKGTRMIKDDQPVCVKLTFFSRDSSEIQMVT